LKRLITENWLTIEGKSKPLKTVKNMLHIFMASNAEWVVAASLEARRLFVLDVKKRTPEERNIMSDATYFKAIQDELDNGGYEAMPHDLQHMPLSGFNIREVPRAPRADRPRDSRSFALY
jgi:hypothetical protein